MKRLAALGCLGVVLVAAPTPGDAVRPALVPLDESGFARVVSARKGKVVLVNFWATWCEPCREEMPQLAALEGRWRERGLVLLTVSADEPEQAGAAREFLDQCGIKGPAYIKRATSDEAFINSVDPKWSGALPALFLYGRDGKRAASMVGETPVAEIEAAIRKLLP